MNHTPDKPDDSWENDAVWKLLDHASSASAGPRFVDTTVRAARLEGQATPWWKRVLSPVPIAGLAGATAALFFSASALFGPSPEPTGDTTASLDSQQAAEIQDIAETEVLFAAVDHIDAFSDNELVTLIGF